MQFTKVMSSSLLPTTTTTTTTTTNLLQQRTNELQRTTDNATTEEKMSTSLDHHHLLLLPKDDNRLLLLPKDDDSTTPPSSLDLGDDNRTDAIRLRLERLLPKEPSLTNLLEQQEQTGTTMNTTSWRRATLQRLHRNNYLQHAITLIICLNAICLAVSHCVDRPVIPEVVPHGCNLVLTILLTMDVGLHILASSFRLFFGWFNGIDFLLVGVFWVEMTGGALASTFRALALLRLVKLFFKLREIKDDEINNLRWKLDTAIGIIANLKTDMADKNPKITELVVGLHGEHQRATNALGHTLEATTELLAKAELENRTLSEELIRTKKGMENVLIKNNNEVKKLAQQLEESQQHIESLHQEGEKHQKAAVDHMQQAVTAKQETSGLRQQVAQLVNQENEIKELTQQLAQSQDQEGLLQHEVEAMKHELSVHVQALAALEQERRKLKAEFEEKSNALGAAVDMINNQWGSYNTLKKEHDRLKDNLKEVRQVQRREAQLWKMVQQRDEVIHQLKHPVVEGEDKRPHLLSRLKQLCLRTTDPINTEAVVQLEYAGDDDVWVELRKGY